MSLSLLLFHTATSDSRDHHFSVVPLCFCVNPVFLKVITFWHFFEFIFVGRDFNSLPCWEIILPGSPMFLHILQAEVLTPFVSESLPKDIFYSEQPWKVDTLESRYSFSFRAEGRLACCLATQKWCLALEQSGPACPWGKAQLLSTWGSSPGTHKEPAGVQVPPGPQCMARGNGDLGNQGKCVNSLWLLCCEW